MLLNSYQGCITLFIGAYHRAPALTRGDRIAARMDQGGSDPVNNVSPEVRASALRYAQLIEDVFLAGKTLWGNLKRMRPTKPIRIFFVGTNGNSGAELAESLMDGLGYEPATDGTPMITRTPDTPGPPIRYTLFDTDKVLATKIDKSPLDLFIEDEEKYRGLETEVLKEFVDLPYDGYPMGCLVGEGAVIREENKAVLETGLVIWLDVGAMHAWEKTQFRGQGGGGLYIPKEFLDRPPLFAIANGWDGDVDDTEGFDQYKAILEERRPHYEAVQNITLRTDVAGVAENSYWGADRLTKAINKFYDFKKGVDAVFDDKEIEREMAKFLEGARLSKYLKQALEWCEAQGANSIEDIAENWEDFAEAMDMKPLERKRLEKTVATLA